MFMGLRGRVLIGAEKIAGACATPAVFFRNPSFFEPLIEEFMDTPPVRIAPNYYKVTPLARDKLLAFLNSMMKSSKAAMFLHPVDPIALNLPDYLSIIKKPMDLYTINSKLTSGEYDSNDSFFEDLDLVWSNCLLYNPPTLQIYKNALDFQKQCIKFHKSLTTTSKSTSLTRSQSLVDKHPSRDERKRLAQKIWRLAATDPDACSRFLDPLTHTPGHPWLFERSDDSGRFMLDLDKVPAEVFRLLESAD